LVVLRKSIATFCYWQKPKSLLGGPNYGHSGPFLRLLSLELVCFAVVWQHESNFLTNLTFDLNFLWDVLLVRLFLVHLRLELRRFGGLLPPIYARRRGQRRAGRRSWRQGLSICPSLSIWPQKLTGSLVQISPRHVDDYLFQKQLPLTVSRTLHQLAFAIVRLTQPFFFVRGPLAARR
jgi:hypothetical protein